jgi:hypothetical protein
VAGIFAEERFKWGLGGLCVVVFTPRLPPTALLHYRDFDVVCSELGGVCVLM